MILKETRRMIVLFFTALCMLLILTAFPSHAYIDRGDVQIGSPEKSTLTIGESVSMSITPYEEDHYPGCQMAECPAICGEKDCITYVNGQMECMCEGTEMHTYYAIVETSSSDPSVASVEYDDHGSVVITAVGEGSTQISVKAMFREYHPASESLTITVEKESAGSNDEKTQDPDPSGTSGTGQPGNSGTENGGNSTGNTGNGSDSNPASGTEGNAGTDQQENTGGSDAASRYPVELASAEECHAVLSCDKSEAAAGEVVMIRASASEGYKLKGIIVTDAQGNAVATKGVGGIYEFTMPAGAVKVSSEVTEVVPEVQKPFPFTDVAADRWSRSSVEFVYNRSLFNGTEETLFSPEMTMTRGMLVTVLYRLDGSPEVSGNSSFTDVAADAYYAKAVKWASDHEIVLGIEEGQFAPDALITREQLVTIMYRYAKFKGYNTNFTGILQDFSDDNRQISSYAETPFKWAVSRGIVTGVTPTSLAPQGSATREQVATIIMRFVQKFVN